MDDGVHVEVIGSGNDPILLLPGGGVRDPAYLGDVARWGSPRPLAVVHFRGTPSSPGVPRPWWDQCDELERVRRRLGVERMDVLAHSSGTRVALAYAARAGTVARLGLITPPATWLTGTGDDIEALAADRMDEAVIREALAEPPLSLTTPEAFLAWQRATAPLGYARWDDAAQAHSATGATDVDALKAFFGAPPPPELVDAITALDVPVHVIGGAKDLLSGNRPVRELAALFRNGTIRMIDDAGHYPWVDQPVAFREAIAGWVADTSGTSHVR